MQCWASCRNTGPRPRWLLSRGCWRLFQGSAAQAALTGESQPVAKLADAAPAAAPLAERSSMIFMNTVISRGRLEAVVTATGMATEMGRLAGLLAQAEETQTPLQVELD